MQHPTHETHQMPYPYSIDGVADSQHFIESQLGEDFRLPHPQMRCMVLRNMHIRLDGKMPSFSFGKMPPNERNKMFQTTTHYRQPPADKDANPEDDNAKINLDNCLLVSWFVLSATNTSARAIGLNLGIAAESSPQQSTATSQPKSNDPQPRHLYVDPTRIPVVYTPLANTEKEKRKDVPPGGASEKDQLLEGAMEEKKDVSLRVAWNNLVFPPHSKTNRVREYIRVALPTLRFMNELVNGIGGVDAPNFKDEEYPWPDPAFPNVTWVKMGGKLHNAVNVMTQQALARLSQEKNVEFKAPQTPSGVKNKTMIVDDERLEFVPVETTMIALARDAIDAQARIKTAYYHQFAEMKKLTNLHIDAQVDGQALDKDKKFDGALEVTLALLIAPLDGLGDPEQVAQLPLQLGNGGQVQRGIQQFGRR